MAISQHFCMFPFVLSLLYLDQTSIARSLCAVFKENAEALVVQLIISQSEPQNEQHDLFVLAVLNVCP